MSPGRAAGEGLGRSRPGAALLEGGHRASTGCVQCSLSHALPSPAFAADVGELWQPLGSCWLCSRSGNLKVPFLDFHSCRLTMHPQAL